jgi:DNA primase
MSTIDEVKARVDIVDLISEHVQLKRAGRNFSGLCPFHSERTPSFIVTPERQTWHCFGACGTGGDIFSFVMKRENVEFAEALRILAQRAGVSLAERRDPREDERGQRATAANDAAAAFFHDMLLHAKAAREARDYLQTRGLDLETIEAFQLGYSLDSWDALQTHLTERGYSSEELLAVGLLTEGERGPHDRFRARLMFPIRDDRGRTVGFGGRTLSSDPKAGAKYINTAQTPMFDKGAILYALDRAKEAIRREKSVIVVEGYMDVIAAHQHGITNVVASMGTALTERQIRALERFKCRILLAMDADAAGIEATLRALQEAGEAGAIRASADSSHPSALPDEDFTARVQEWTRNGLKRAAVNFYVVPLLGKDPDEMIRKDGAAWNAALEHAKPFTDHVFDVVAARHDLSQPVERAALLTELLPVVRLIDEPVYRAHYVQRLARLAQLGEEALRDELRKTKRPSRLAPPSAPAPSRRGPREHGEEYCLALLLRSPELRREGLGLTSDVFSLGENRAIYEAWRSSTSIDDIRDAIPDELHSHFDTILQRDVPFLETSHLRDAFEDCVRRINLRRLAQAKQASTAALSEPDLQPYMSAAVEEAAVLHGTRAGAKPDGTATHNDSRARELAETLLEDKEMGRRLHQPALARSTQQAEVSPQSEVEQ